MMSYPNYAGSDRMLNYPDIVRLAKIAEKAVTQSSVLKNVRKL